MAIDAGDRDQLLSLLDAGVGNLSHTASVESHNQGQAVPERLVGDRLLSEEFDLASLSGPALRAFFKLAALWCLSDDEQVRLLGVADKSMIRSWREGEDQVCLDSETITRISYLLGIFRIINNLLPDPVRADGWIRRPNRARPFAGRSALERMIGGGLHDLRAVRDYLNAQQNS
jgi:hypothetical protein